MAQNTEEQITEDVELTSYTSESTAPVAGEAAAQQALRLRPGHPEALARLGRTRWMQARHGEAPSARAASSAASAACTSTCTTTCWRSFLILSTHRPQAKCKIYEDT